MVGAVCSDKRLLQEALGLGKSSVLTPAVDPQSSLLRAWGHILLVLLVVAAAGSLFSAVRSSYAHRSIYSSVRVNCHHSVPMPQQQLSAQRLVDQAANNEEQHIPKALEQLLMCITFHWNPTKLVYLMTVLQALATYRTNVDVAIVTDKAGVLSTALEGLNTSIGLANIDVWQPKAPSRDDAFWLTYEHRHLIQSKVKAKNYTTVMYVEDDTYVSWPVLVSWALDSQVLQTLNFTRCFYRTEVHHATGKKVLLDWRTKGNVTDMQWIDVNRIDASRAAYQESLGRVKSKTCGEQANGVLQPCKDSLHRHFVSPLYPFQGMWVLTMKQLDGFMRHPYWSKYGSVHANLGQYNSWGYPERSNSVNLFVNVPKGYGSNCMVPVVQRPVALSKHKLNHAADPVSPSDPPKSNRTKGHLAEVVGVSWWPQLPAVAEVRHLRNGYGSHNCLAQGPVKCGRSGNHSSIPVEEAFIA